MISRVAENCFWLMRQMERCDAQARVLRVHSEMVLDTVLPAARTWRPMLIVLGEEPSFVERFGDAAASDGDVVQEYLTWDEACPVSVRSSLVQARENARTLRETVSREMWQALNSFHLWLGDKSARRTFASDRSAFYEEVEQRCFHFQGACQNTMLHEEPFDFMRLGLNLERAGQTARMLDIAYHALGPDRGELEGGIEAAEWLAILRSRAGYEPFFKKRRAAVSGRAVSDFLLRERTFPGSVTHALSRALNFLQRIRERAAAGSAIGESSWNATAALLADVEALDSRQIRPEEMHEILTWIVDRSGDVSRAIREDYFLSGPEGRSTEAPSEE